MSNKMEEKTMKPAAKRALKPKLRFPEFRDAGEWEEKQLHQIAKPVSDKASDRNNDKMLTLSGEHGLVLQSDYFGKKIAGDNVERYIRIALNDFVYNDRTTKLSVYGSIKRLSKYESGIVSPIYKCFRFGAGENPVFWDWYFESGFHEPQLHGLVNEGARAGRFNISIEMFLSTLVWYPGPAEQQKIADCLSSIDELIIAEAQKLDTLKAHKKGLMQQLFPAEGETLPKLRFPDFNDDLEWKEYSINELIIKKVLCAPKDGNHGNLHPKSSDYVSAGIPFIMASDLQNGEIDYSKCAYISKEQADSLQKGFAEEGDVLLTHKGTVGEVALLNKIEFPYLMLTPQVTYYRIIDKNKLSNKFLATLFESEGFQRNLKVAAGGGTRAYIGITEQGKLKISIPFNILEQQKIADCFFSLNELIITQNQKLDALKAHKKGLMQQLFSALDEVQG
jgi:type I restriction enzyme S subunit